MLTLLVGILGSCAVHKGDLRLPITDLSRKNFRYVESVQGSASTASVLGFGNGLSRTALIDEAKRNMLLNNPLQPNQALINVTTSTDQKLIFAASIANAFTIGLYVKTTETITADIIEFTE